VCAYCHDAQPDDNLYALWATSGHSNVDLANGAGGPLDDTAVYDPVAGTSVAQDVSHCGRCHTAQGFIAFVPQLLSGNGDQTGFLGPAGSIQGTPVPTASAAAGGITVNNIEAQSCQACHDPHSLGVRVLDPATSIMLPAGFAITGGGSGAVCSACHNTRNGFEGVTNSASGPYFPPSQHNDATPWTDARATGPHKAAQADIYYAGNGYLLGAAAPLANFHADIRFFPDTCASCHVKQLGLDPNGLAPLSPSSWPTASSNHTFKADSTTCVACHGAGVEFTTAANAVASGIAAYELRMVQVLNAAGITSVKGKLNGAATATTVNVTGKTIAAAAPTPGSHSVAFDLTFTDGTTVTAIAVGSVATPTNPALLKNPDGSWGIFAKALYDWYLITDDASNGVHNLPFVKAMLTAMSTNLSLP
jgi:hypothetical protein